MFGFGGKNSKEREDEEEEKGDRGPRRDEGVFGKDKAGIDLIKERKGLGNGFVGLNGNGGFSLSEEGFESIEVLAIMFNVKKDLGSEGEDKKTDSKKGRFNERGKYFPVFTIYIDKG